MKSTSQFTLFGILGFELRASHLLGRHSKHLSLSPALFCFSYFSGRVLCFCPGPASGSNPLIYGLASGWQETTTWLIDWDGGLTNFCPGYAQTLILLIFASQVGGITAMSHHAQPRFIYLKCKPTLPTKYIEYILNDHYLTYILFFFCSTGNWTQGLVQARQAP
jgi:hypothetical protein